MPLVDYDSEAMFNDFHMYGCVGGYFSENKETIWDLCKHYLLLPQLSITPGQSVLLVGAGFGWIAEKWIAEGIGPICALDTSQWIQSIKHQHATVPIHDYDVTDYSTHSAIKQILGLQETDKIDWCITEDFYTGISDQECLTIASALRDLGNNIVHYISRKPVREEVLSVPSLAVRNWKTEKEWSALLAPDRVIMR